MIYLLPSQSLRGKTNTVYHPVSLLALRGKMIIYLLPSQPLRGKMTIDLSPSQSLRGKTNTVYHPVSLLAPRGKIMILHTDWEVRVIFHGYKVSKCEFRQGIIPFDFANDDVLSHDLFQIQLYFRLISVSNYNILTTEFDCLLLNSDKSTAAMQNQPQRRGVNRNLKCETVDDK